MRRQLRRGRAALHAHRVLGAAGGQAGAAHARSAAVAPPGLQSQISNRAAIASNSSTANPFNRDRRAGPPAAEPAAPTDAGLAATLGDLPQLETAGGSDYTVYTKKDLTVRRGERAIVTLLVKRINYSHIYRWSPPEEIQHFLVLQNDTDSAWTTGPCLALSNDQPLGEDLLRTRRAAGSCEIPLTTSVNVAHARQEEETDRKFKVLLPAKDVSLDLVTLGGVLKLENFEQREVDVVITNPVPGRPISASDGGVTRVDPTRLKLVERSGSIRWTLEKYLPASRRC